MFQCTLDTEQVNQNSVNFFQGFYYEMTGLTGERSLTIVFLCNQAVIKTVVLNKYLEFLLFQQRFLQWYFVNVPTLDIFFFAKTFLQRVHCVGCTFWSWIWHNFMSARYRWILKTWCMVRIMTIGILENRPNRYIECRSTCTIHIKFTFPPNNVSLLDDLKTIFFILYFCDTLILHK